MPSRDELANRGKAFFDDLKAEIFNEPDLKLRAKALRLEARMHAAANELLALAKTHGKIQPFSGGEPKPN